MFQKLFIKIINLSLYLWENYIFETLVFCKKFLNFCKFWAYAWCFLLGLFLITDDIFNGATGLKYIHDTIISNSELSLILALIFLLINRVYK